MDPSNTTFEHQLSLLLAKHRKEREELQKQSEKNEEDVSNAQLDDLLKRQQEEIEELTLQFQVVENTDNSGMGTPSLVIIVLAIVFSVIALAGFTYLKGEQSILVSNVKDNAELNLATSVIAKSAIDGVQEVKAEVERVETVANKALTATNTLTPKVQALELYNTDVVAPTISKFDAKIKALNKKDLELKKALALVNKTLNKNKVDLIARNKARQALYANQSTLNLVVHDQIIAMKKEIAIIEIEKGKTNNEVMKLAYAECTDTKRSKGYSKKECDKNYEFVQSLRKKTKKPVVKTTTTIHALVVETTSKK
mgnify:CR=1 FL=1